MSENSAGTHYPEWAELLQELEERREVALAAGGPENVEKQHRKGRSTARERIRKLADEGSFLEIGTFVTTPGEGEAPPLGPTFVCGLCEVDGRPVAIGAEEFGIEGGGTGVHLAHYKGGWGGFIEEFAFGYRIPLVMLINGVGGSVALQDAIGYPELQSANSAFPIFELLEKVPVVAAVLGPTAGSSAARAHISHFSVMAEDNGCLFAGGPPVVKQALGQEVDKFQLGGADVHTRVSGLIDNRAADEGEALDTVRAFLAYMPDNVGTRPPTKAEWHEHDQEELLSIVPPNPRRVYDAGALVRCVVDQGTFFEIAPEYGQALRTGLARIEGRTVGVFASDSRSNAGSLDAQSSQKQARFARLCDRFHIPIVYLVDVPGFLVGPKAEQEGVLKFGTDAIKAIRQADVPVFTVQVRRSYGLGGLATGSRDPMSIRLIWPSAAWGDMPVSGGIDAAYRAELEAASAEDRQTLKEELMKRFEEQTSIWRAVERFAVEEMIDPRETRRYLARLVRLAYHRPLTGPAA